MRVQFTVPLRPVTNEIWSKLVTPLPMSRMYQFTVLPGASVLATEMHQKLLVPEGGTTCITGPEAPPAKVEAPVAVPVVNRKAAIVRVKPPGPVLPDPTSPVESGPIRVPVTMKLMSWTSLSSGSIVGFRETDTIMVPFKKVGSVTCVWPVEHVNSTGGAGAGGRHEIWTNIW